MDNVNQAVMFLIKQDGGWTHRFYNKNLSGLCRICGEASREHENVTNSRLAAAVPARRSIVEIVNAHVA